MEVNPTDPNNNDYLIRQLETKSIVPTLGTMHTSRI